MIYSTPISINKAHSLGKILLRIVFILCSLLLIANLIRKVSSGADLSFSAFLNWLGNVNYFKINFNISSWTIGGDWGIIDGLRKFFNMFGNLFGLIFYMCANLISLVSFLTQFLAFVFVQGFRDVFNIQYTQSLCPYLWSTFSLDMCDVLGIGFA